MTTADKVFTAPAAGAACFTKDTFKLFSDDKCAVAQDAAAPTDEALLATQLVGKCDADAAKALKIFLKACIEGEFHYVVGANIAKKDDKCDATATAALGATKYTAIKAVADKKTGADPCTKVSAEGAAAAVYATWTGAGWADAKADDTTTADNATGAKAMAGALAAGALAVAATQF